MKKSSKEPLKGLKQQLPQKECAACGKPFNWRKKWALNWAQVKWCSERCRRAGGKA